MSEENKENNKQNTESLSKKDSKPSEPKQKEVMVKNSEEKKSSEKSVNESTKVNDQNKTKKIDKPDQDLINKTKIKSSLNEKTSAETKQSGKLSVKPNISDSKEKNSNRKNSESNEKNDGQNKSAEQNELLEKLVSINRVAKVVKGGRRFSFAALVVVGDGNGMVGHGKGKAKEVPEAIKKATDEAKNRMIRVPLRQGRTLHHDIKGRYDAGRVYLRSAPSGTGVIAGGPMRAVFEALGIQDIVAKSVGTSNPHNMVRATFEALKSASSPKIIAMRRGLKINDITKRRKVNQQGQEDGKN